MTESREIRVLVDGGVPSKHAAQLPPGFENAIERSVCLAKQTVEVNLNEAIDSILSVLEGVPTENRTYDVDSVSFSLVLDASGEVSLLSLVRGGIGAHTGIQVTLKRKKGTIR